MIDENSIEIRKNEKVAYIACQNHLCFARAVPFIKNNENHLTVSGYEKGGQHRSFLQQYKLPDF